MRGVSLALLFASSVAAAAPPTPVTLVACAPGYPGTTAEAQPRMDALAAAVASGAGLAADGVAAVYAPGEADGLARLARPDAAVALVPLPFLVAHGEAIGLVPRMQVVVAGGGPTEVWSLVARKGRVRAPTQLAGFAIHSTAGYAPAFVRGALAGWGTVPPTTRIVQSAAVLSALRKSASGEDVAVLLDGAQSAALATLPFSGELEIVARSAPVPTSFVATVGNRLPPARWRALERALAGLGASPEGAAALEALRIARFVAADPAAISAARRLADAGRAR
jgi:hypothetical protein